MSAPPTGPASVPRPLTIMLVVGEPSGDQLGGQLIAALKALAGPRLTLVGVGGTAMTAQGVQSLFPLDDTAVMGLREVVPRIPAILRRVRQTADFALKVRPDLVVLIDSPDFTHRIAQRLKRLDPSIRTANYVAPQVWASRGYRAGKMAHYFDAVLALLPFEPPFFEAHGLRALFVGHPVLERAPLMKGGPEFRARHGIAPRAPLLAVLPGSRRNEIRFILPVFKQTVGLLARDMPDLRCVLPTVSHVAAAVRAGAAGWPTPLTIIANEGEKFAAFAAADAALAASGTVTSELALARTPTVVGYRVGWLTFLLSKPLMRVAHITLINLIRGKEVIPEFLQGRCTPALLAPAVKRLLTNAAARSEQRAEIDLALNAMGEGGESPSVRAARAVLALAEAP